MVQFQLEFRAPLEKKKRKLEIDNFFSNKSYVEITNWFAFFW